MEAIYDVCFAGQLLEGQDLQTVRANVQKLFKANPETLEKLFSGKTQLLKKGCDKATALKYKQAMERAGAKAIVRDTQAAEVSQTTGNTSGTTAVADNQALDIAPVGADVLRPEERTETTPVSVDTSALDLAEAGATLGESAPTEANAPDTSHLSMADVGETIPTLSDGQLPVEPNIDGIELSPEDTGFSDCAAPVADAPYLDLSNMEVAPAGSDVLPEEYKKKDEAVAPDTDHIKLQD